MSKDNKGKKDGTAATKAKRPKTPAQLARKAKNEQDHAARLLALKAEQERFNALRAEHGPMSDEQCRDLLAEKAARADLDLLLACDMQVGGEPFSKRLMRFLGRERLKGIAAGQVAVREVIGAAWNYARTQDSHLRPVDE
jgi:hypothetical protein